MNSNYLKNDRQNYDKKKVKKMLNHNLLRKILYKFEYLDNTIKLNCIFPYLLNYNIKLILKTIIKTWNKKINYLHLISNEIYSDTLYVYNPSDKLKYFIKNNKICINFGNKLKKINRKFMNLIYNEKKTTFIINNKGLNQDDFRYYMYHKKKDIKKNSKFLEIKNVKYINLRLSNEIFKHLNNNFDDLDSFSTTFKIDSNNYTCILVSKYFNDIDVQVNNSVIYKNIHMYDNLYKEIYDRTY